MEGIHMTNPTTQPDDKSINVHVSGKDMSPETMESLAVMIVAAHKQFGQQDKTVTISAELSDAYVRLQRAMEAYLELGNSARMKRMSIVLEDVRKAGVAHG
jgi:hypothetical protein